MGPATLLRLDGAVNALGGLGLVVAAGLLATPLGLGSTWPLRLLGVVLVVYGAENVLVARAEGHRGVGALAAVDVVSGVLALGAAAIDPTDATAAARWIVAAVGVASLTVGVAKVVLSRRTAGPGLRQAAA